MVSGSNSYGEMLTMLKGIAGSPGAVDVGLFIVEGAFEKDNKLTARELSAFARDLVGQNDFDDA